MSIKELIKYLINPDLLNKDTLPLLKSMLDEYPYFEALRMLYLKNLYLLKDLRFNVELKKSAILIADRTFLYQLIHTTTSPFIAIAEEQKRKKDRTLSLIDAYISEYDKSQGSDITTDDYLLQGIYPIEALPTLTEQVEEVAPMKHQDLIDQFIAEGNEEAKCFIDLDSEPGLIPSPTLQEDSLMGNEDYFTETLAHIYIKQHRYERALEIIKRLYLNYPEKSIYFAAQMDHLEELIANDKNK